MRHVVDEVEIVDAKSDREYELLVSWRHEKLHKAGFDDADMKAYLIAGDLRIDVDEVCRMLEHGCPPETAYRIVT